MKDMKDNSEQELDNKIWDLIRNQNNYSSDPEDYIKPYRDLIHQETEHLKSIISDQAKEIEEMKAKVRFLENLHKLPREIDPY